MYVLYVYGRPAEACGVGGVAVGFGGRGPGGWSGGR